MFKLLLLFACWIKSNAHSMTCCLFWSVRIQKFPIKHVRKKRYTHFRGHRFYKFKRRRPFYRRSGNGSNIGNKLPLKKFNVEPIPTSYALSAKVGQHHQAKFDTDSYSILIDNCASRSITNDSSDFIDEPRKIRGVLTGLGSTVSVKSKGTVKWHIEDDNGKVHNVIVPNTLYIPNSPTRLLSPQHWAQHNHKQGDSKDGTLAITYADRIELYWFHRKFC